MAVQLYHERMALRAQLDSSLVPLLPKLYSEGPHEENLVLPCKLGGNCSEPAEFNLTYTESIRDEAVHTAIEQNRTKVLSCIDVAEVTPNMVAAFVCLHRVVSFLEQSSEDMKDELLGPDQKRPVHALQQQACSLLANIIALDSAQSRSCPATATLVPQIIGKLAHFTPCGIVVQVEQLAASMTQPVLSAALFKISRHTLTWWSRWPTPWPPLGTAHAMGVAESLAVAWRAALSTPTTSSSALIISWSC